MIEKLVPDTSAVIEGVVSKRLESKDIVVKKIIIPELVMAELEHQANENMEKGFLGIDEVKRLRRLSEKNDFEIEFYGEYPNRTHIKYADKGAIDSEILDIAYNEGATLITADKVQHLMSEAKGVETIYVHMEA